jgi:8-amino-7-oxononanoate synthase
MSSFRRELKPILSRKGAHITTNLGQFVDFSSNDILGIATNEVLLDEFNNLKFNQFGSTGSRLLTGDYCVFHDFENQLVEWLGIGCVFLFNTGYQLNAGVLSAILTASDIIFMDKQCHASLINGALASKAKVVRYHHQNMTHLKQMIVKYRGQYENAMLVTESIFSMNGRHTDIDELIAMKHQFNLSLYIDEAHAIGVYGPNGCGRCEDVMGDIDFLVGTFGKAFGGFGSFLGCRHPSAPIILNQCRSFIYTTSLPLPVVSWNQLSLSYIQNNPNMRRYVLELARYFRDQLSHLNIPFTGDGHIIAVRTDSTERTMALSKLLALAHCYVLPILPPTVPIRQCCVRISITAMHQKADIDRVITAVSGYFNP